MRKAFSTSARCRPRKANFSRDSLIFSLKNQILTLIIDGNSTKEINVAVRLLSHFARVPIQGQLCSRFDKHHIRDDSEVMGSWNQSSVLTFGWC
jgi:hypothetical protein